MKNNRDIRADMMSHPQRTTPMKRCLQLVKGQSSIIIILMSVVVGFLIGLGLLQLDLSDDVILWISIPGELYIRAIKAIIVPLLVCLIFNTASNLDPKVNGRIALVSITGSLLTHIMSVTIGVCLFFVFRIDPRDTVRQQTIQAPLKTGDVFADLLRNLIPDNMLAATFSQTVTTYKLSKVSHYNKTADQNGSLTEVMVRGIGRTDGVNVLGLLTVCTILGIAAQKVLQPNATLRNFFQQGQKLMIVVMNWVFWVTPIGVISLIVGSLGKVKDIGDTFEALGVLIGSVSLGLCIHLGLMLSILYFLITRRNPYAYIAQCVRPSAISFASMSSTVALPEMIASSTRCGVHPKVTNFVVPMSLSLHADGSGLYIVSSALFIGQLSGSLQNTETIFVIATLCTLMSMIIPPIPSSSIITLLLILSSMNIPTHDVAMLFAVEWLLDRLRSAVNTTSHVLLAIGTSHICKNHLRHTDVTNDVEEGEVEPNEEASLRLTKPTDDVTHQC